MDISNRNLCKTLVIDINRRFFPNEYIEEVINLINDKLESYSGSVIDSNAYTINIVSNNCSYLIDHYFWEVLKNIPDNNAELYKGLTMDDFLYIKKKLHENSNSIDFNFEEDCYAYGNNFYKIVDAIENILRTDERFTKEFVFSVVEEAHSLCSINAKSYEEARQILDERIKKGKYVPDPDTVEVDHSVTRAELMEIIE